MPNESQLSVHIGDNVTVKCISGPSADGNRNTYLTWKFGNKSEILVNVKSIRLSDIHTASMTCDVLRLDISDFTKENEGNYSCIKRTLNSSNVNVRIFMIGKSV